MCCSLARLSHRDETGTLAFTGAEVIPGLARFSLCSSNNNSEAMAETIQVSWRTWKSRRGANDLLVMMRSRAAVLTLEHVIHTSLSPEGLLKTDCWAPARFLLSASGWDLRIGLSKKSRQC